jgi:hypothetical protein
MTEQHFLDALLHFRSEEPDPRLRPDPYHLREVAERVCSAFSAPHLDEALTGRLRWRLLDGLRRLDALPRDDPFWQGTNRRPTLGKLRDLAERELHRGPRPAWACWAYAATSVLWCCNDFGLPGWQGLHEQGRLQVAWAVGAAFHVYASSGFDTSSALAGFLSGEGLSIETRNALEALEARVGGSFSGWVGQVARGCPVAFDPGWLAWDGGLVGGLAAASRQAAAAAALPVLADALEEAGCLDAALLSHLRGPGPHVRGCWAVGVLLGEG